MYGDFEAQRHWMELTLHLPLRSWYHYDLPYWGLDYPPLTAYHSYLTGFLGSLIQPDWFALDRSRGFESAGLKAFMRANVVGWEILVWWTALGAWIYGGESPGKSRRMKVCLEAIHLFQFVRANHLRLNSNSNCSPCSFSPR